MKLTVLILSISLCVASTQRTYAQKDYIVNLSNDTLWGEVKKPLIGKPRFTETGQSKSISITEKNAKAYRRTINSNESESFVAKVLPKRSKPIFLERLEDGNVQLFELIQTSNSMYASSTTKSWYVCKAGGELFNIKTNALSFARAEKENNLEGLLGDNKELWNQFKTENDFSFKVLRNYIKLYNQAAAKNSTK